jgi:hypothetical protein
VGLNDKPGLQPSQMPLSPETQADGLGWYGGAPSVLSFATIRTSAPQARCYPSPGPGADNQEPNRRLYDRNTETWDSSPGFLGERLGDYASIKAFWRLARLSGPSVMTAQQYLCTTVRWPRRLAATQASPFPSFRCGLLCTLVGTRRPNMKGPTDILKRFRNYYGLIRSRGVVFLGRKPREATWLRSTPIAKPL